MCDVPAKRVSEDKQRRAAFKAQILDARRKARFEKGRPQRDARMSTLLRLLDAVLEVEPWNSGRHASCRGAAWRDCGLRVPGLLKDSDLSRARRTVQKRIHRLARQLNDPKAGYPWKLYPAVKHRVEKVAAQLAVASLSKQQGAVEPKNSNPATVEKAHAIPEQPATEEQRQQQGPETPTPCYALHWAIRSYAAAAEGVSASAIAR